MGKSRSRSRSRGRWGDPNSDGERERSRRERRDRRHERSRSREHRHRSRERERSRDRRQERDRSRSRSRDPKRRRGASPLQHDNDAGRSYTAVPHDADGRNADIGRRADREGGLGRERDLDRARDGERDRGKDNGRERDRDGDRGRDRHRDRSRDRKHSRSHSQSRERDDRGGHRRGSPRRHEGGTAAADAAGADQPRRRWRSPSLADARRGGDGRGDGSAWNNPPPPPFMSGRPPPPPLSVAPPPVGSIHRGTVHTIRPFGIFVALPGYKRHVMVHNTQVSDELRFTREDDEDAKVKALEFYFPRGEQVWVKIQEVTPDERNPAEMRVNGSLRAVDQASGTDLDPEGLLAAAEQHGGGGGGGGGRGRGGPETDEPPEVGSVHRATVKRVEAYGVFVALEGYRRHGLVHTSQVSNYLSFSREDSDEQKKAELAGVVTVGEQIWVKVVEVTPDEARGGYKIGCSIKLVSQADGEDLDPANTRYKPRDAAGRPGGGGPIGAAAGEVGKGGKIDWGHLAADTKLYVNEKAAAQYKLLEEEPLPGPPPGPPGQAPGGRGGPPRPGPPPPSGPMGRGRGMVLPAWMTQGSAAGGGPPAPGSLPGPPPLPPSQQPAPNQLPASSKFELIGGRDRDVDPSTLLLDLVGGGGGAGGQRISSIEEALAILEAHGGGRGKKEKKDNKKKDKKKKDKKSSKKSKRSSSRRSRSSSSGSSSDSDSDGRRRR